MKMKYIRKFSDGTRCMDAEGFQSLKEEQTILCYNKEEPNILQLEFFCSICNRGFKGLRSCEIHWTNSKHKKQLHSHEVKIKHCKKLRKLSATEDSELSEILIKMSERLMSESDYVERKNICKDFEETIKASGFDVLCQLYGSSITRVGFCDSNVNIDIQFDMEKISKIMPLITDVPLFLFDIHSTIKSSDKFCDVVDLFHTSTPKFTFTHVQSGLHCVVCPYHKPGVKTSFLIMDYVSMDERVKILCIAFRRWATICGVDDAAGGSLTTYCFTIMMIHYLQQVDPPVLPVIKLAKAQYLPPGIHPRNGEALISTDQIGSWKSNNKSSVGMLWVGLFKYYLTDFFFKTLVVNITQHAPMTKHLRGLNSRRISIEDPFFQKDNIANTLTSSEVMDYFYSCLEKSYRHFSLYPAIAKGDKKITPDISPGKAEHKKRRDEKRKSGELSDTKKTINKKEEKEKDEPYDQDDESTKEKGEEHSGEENDKNCAAVEPSDISSKGIDAKSVISDLICVEESKLDNNSEDEDTNSQSDNKNHNENHEDSDSHEEESEDEGSEDEDFVHRDTIENSDVEIEEEYIENIHGYLEKIGGEGGDRKDNEEQNEVLSNNEEIIDKSNMIIDETEETGNDLQTKHITCKTDHLSSSNDETPRNRHSSRDYDSQYDGDVDSQAEDDTESTKVELQCFVFSAEGEENEEVMRESDKITQPIGEIMEGDVNEAPSQRSSGTTVLNSTQDIFHNDISKTDRSLSQNVDQLSLEDHVSNPVEVEKKIENVTDASPNKRNDDTHIDMATNENVENNIEESSGTTNFLFKRRFLAPLRNIPLFCKICSKDGHRKTECESMNIRKPATLQPITKMFLEMLDRLCERIMKDNELTSSEILHRSKILQDMERHLKKHLNPSCRLALFGSSVNNFGFRGSDLDICLRFSTPDPPPGLDHASMVVSVARALDKHGDFHKVMYIKSAKVPIVKFFIGNAKLEGDISLYNCLALNNSRMLKAYASIDTRVRIMGYCAKVFAKVCEMGDASRGSLSSYAYTLLTLYYLQRCEPPVIPVLQELYDHSQEKPRSMVEGWNTWYFSNIEYLAKVWPGYGKNNQSVGELWLGFLRFYVEKFDFTRNVVAMRQIKTLSKFQKGWSLSTMCIEDPFNLQHNLAAGISRNMFRYILSCFQNARVHFHTAHPHFRKNSDTDSLRQYFFNRNHLTENKLVPKDRLCHRCGRIGHTASNCAEKIVAARERRRLDSERTYSSDNGDSDPNTKGKCHGCKKVGHRVANCPQKGRSPAKGRQRNGMNRDRRDSDRKGVVSQAKDNTAIQTAVDLHPLENIDVVLSKSEMTTKFKSETPKRGSKQNTTVKAVDMKIETLNSLFSSPSRVKPVDMKIETLNSLFSSPSPRKSTEPEEKAHNFSPINEMNALKASVEGVSFLKTPTDSPNDKASPLLPSPGRTRVSPLKPFRRLGKETKSANENSVQVPTIVNNQFEFPSLGSGKASNNQESEQPTNVWQTPSGFQHSDFKFIGQAATINRMPSPDNQAGQTTSRLPTDYTPANKRVPNMNQTTQRNGILMTPTRNTQGFHFSQPEISRHMSHPDRGNQGHMQNQATSPTKVSRNSPGQQTKQDNFTSTQFPFSKSQHWPQAPPPPPGFTQVNHESTMKGNENIQGSPQKDFNPSSFDFDNFKVQYVKANSPPKGTKEFQYVSSPEKSSDISHTNLPMKYDEEYPKKTSKKKGNNKSRRGKNRIVTP